MLHRFQTYIRNQALFSSGDQILLGVSGGLDSVVMAHLFAQSPYRFGIAHCNFQLRGEESDQEERFVATLAKQLNVPFFVKAFPTASLAAQKNTSIQMLARTLRYAWFEELCQLEGFDYLATGHHLNDSLETLWLNLIRGTGIAGLHGILPLQGKRVRPMLFARRAEIQDYALQEGFSWCEDSSNQENYYRRNFIRNTLLPAAKKLNPNLESTTAQTLEKLRAVEEIFLESIAQDAKTLLYTEGETVRIHFMPLLKAKGAVLRLFHLLEPYGYSYPQSKAIWQSLQGISGKVFHSALYTLNKDRETLIISPKKEGIPQETLDLGETPGELQLGNSVYSWSTYPKTAEFSIPGTPMEAVLDRDKLHFPLQLRSWKQGDYFYPLGMNHRQKISDFLINQKVPLPMKLKVMVLCSGDDIIWVPGYRIDHRFRITAQTKLIFHLKKDTESPVH